MPSHDVVVIGGGISGLAFARQALAAQRRVLLLEAASELGGCVATVTTPDGFWIELGAHTCYNSYVELLTLIEQTQGLGQLRPRSSPVLRFLEDGKVGPGKNLGALLRRMRLGQLLVNMPRGLGKAQAGRSVRDYYGAIIGYDNFDRVLGPMLSAVPSQCANDFPADMLFKKRDRRRKDVMRSFTMVDGLGTMIAGLSAHPALDIRTSASADRIERRGTTWRVVLRDGAEFEAPMVALAVPPTTAARLMNTALPAASAAIASVQETRVDSLGVVVDARAVTLAPATFLIPQSDSFHSVVTRDVVPDAERRGFVFHFKPGLTPAARRTRAAEVLGVPEARWRYATERSNVLPSPRVGHHAIVEAMDRSLAGQPLAVVGNWFLGLSLEDCAQRAVSEWQRVAQTL